MDEEDLDDLTDDKIPAPVDAALRYLGYCCSRQQPVDTWGEPIGVERDLDLDEMRTREAALTMLSRYFGSFCTDSIAAAKSA